MTNTTKITKRERFLAIIDILTNAGADADLIDMCNTEIAMLDRKAEKAKELNATKKAERTPEPDAMLPIVEAAIKTFPTTEFTLVADVTAKVAESIPDVTTHKVAYRLVKLVQAGVLESSDVLVKTEDGKSKLIKGYRVI